MGINFKAQIIFLATHWGSKFGGVNAFNCDLCRALADITKKYQIICAVLKADDNQISEAYQKKIRLISLNQEANIKEFGEDLAYKVVNVIQKKDEYPLWFIGHDIITGAAALKCRELSNRKNESCKVAIIHHMNYEAYGSFKSIIRDVNKKIKLQREVLPKADVLFGVGPKLLESAQDILKINGTKTSNAKEIFPGLPKVQSTELPNAFKAIVFGRISEDTDRVKQFSLAIAACAQAHGELQYLGHDAKISAIGALADNLQDQKNKLQDIATSYGGRQMAINCYPYVEDRKELMNSLRSHSLCIMPSLHEGFGLVGWEAIAAGVPLLLSENSGLYQLLEERLGGMGTGNVIGVDIKGSSNEDIPDQGDIRTVSSAIHKFNKKKEIYKGNALMLRDIAQSVFTWSHSASIFGQSLNLEDLSFSPFNIRNWISKMPAVGMTNNFFYGQDDRSRQFEIIWNKLKAPSDYTKRLIFFGGISRTLCEDKFIEKFIHWIKDNKKSKLFICYEAGRALKERAHQLNEEKLDNRDAEQNMVVKEQKVIKLKDTLIMHLKENKLDDDRISFIELHHPLTTYAIIGDHDIYLTPLFERRASVTLSLALSTFQRKYSIDVLNYMEYHLNKAPLSPSTIGLITELQQVNQEINANG